MANEKIDPRKHRGFVGGEFTVTPQPEEPAPVQDTEGTEDTAKPELPAKPEEPANQEPGTTN